MIVAGFGFRKNATIDSLRDVFEKTCESIPENQPFHAFATLRHKEKLLQQLASLYDVCLMSIDIDVHRTHFTLTSSYFSLREKGVGSVSEYVALAALGVGAKIITPRFISRDRMATCAIAYKKQ